MTKQETAEASPLKLLRTVFGFKPGQTLSEFAAECAPVKEDTAFIEEVRAYAMQSATE